MRRLPFGPTRARQVGAAATVAAVAFVGVAVGTVVVFLLLTALHGRPFARLNPSGAAPTASAAPVATTTVSLTFDDGHSTSWTGARPVLRANQVNATFYINTGRLDEPGFMTSSQLQTLGADGDDVGGHTLDHPELPTLTHDQAVAEICQDRDNLRKLGFASPTSFAYPFGNVGPDAATMEQIPKDCGYASARMSGGIREPCEPAGPAEVLPPANPYEVRIVDTSSGVLTAERLEALVTCAQRNGGGWVPIMMHDVCDQAGSSSPRWPGTETCAADSFGPISPAELDTFVKWAKTQPDTQIRTMSAVMADLTATSSPATTAQPLPAPMAGGTR